VMPGTGGKSGARGRCRPRAFGARGAATIDMAAPGVAGTRYRLPHARVSRGQHRKNGIGRMPTSIRATGHAQPVSVACDLADCVKRMKASAFPVPTANAFHALSPNAIDISLRETTLANAVDG